MKHIALLRGINVGGNNIIKMTDLRACVEAAGFMDVSTYIQSGNIIFTNPRTSTAALETTLEQTLKDAFGYNGKVVVVTAAELARIVADAPRDFGKNPEAFRYDVIFLKRPLTSSAAATDIPTHPEADTIYAGPHAVYFSRRIALASKSRLSKITALPVYQYVTIRNWNTTTKLLALAQAAEV